jgi:hypothetical protein
MYSSKSKFIHNRQLPPGLFEQKTIRTVPLSHTAYHGKKFHKPGAEAVVGKLKATKHYAIQSVLVPRRRRK